MVQPQPGTAIDAARVIAFPKPKLAGYKMPRQVDFVSDMPREDTGKIFKRKLREPYWSAVARRI